jgi:hypothetical protein
LRGEPNDSPGVSVSGILPNLVETESGVVLDLLIPMASTKPDGLKVRLPM